jgi:hypothetical protein
MNFQRKLGVITKDSLFSFHDPDPVGMYILTNWGISLLCLSCYQRSHRDSILLFCKGRIRPLRTTIIKSIHVSTSVLCHWGDRQLIGIALQICDCCHVLWSGRLLNIWYATLNHLWDLKMSPAVLNSQWYTIYTFEYGRQTYDLIRRGHLEIKVIVEKISIKPYHWAWCLIDTTNRKLDQSTYTNSLWTHALDQSTDYSKLCCFGSFLYTYVESIETFCDTTVSSIVCRESVLRLNTRTRKSMRFEPTW